MAKNLIGIVGAGAWGTALAQTQSKIHEQVTIWAYEKETAECINTKRENRQYLPDIKLNENISATNELENLAASSLVLIVSPAQTIRPMTTRLSGILKPDTPVILCSKGIEQKTGFLLSDIVKQNMTQHELAVLSGPSFAAEVATGKPTAVTLACQNQPLGQHIVESIGHTRFRPYLSDDVTGAEIGGAIKNVLAIAAGIVKGKDLGAGAHAALITRGFHEMSRLGKTLGGKPETMRGLSGLGDLILTCSHMMSRNMSLGFALGQGEKLQAILGERACITEGVFTASAVMQLIEKLNIEMPICQAVNNIIEGKQEVDEAIETLLARPFRQEVV